MEQRSLGNSGLLASRIGLGGNTFGGTAQGDDAIAVIHHAMELGITFIDTADIYNDGRSEQLVGKAVAGRRDKVVVATKGGMYAPEGYPAARLSRRWIMQAAENSLRRLGMDYIDLYQIHKPEIETPLEETLRALDDLVRQGKVRYIGCSNYPAWHLVQGLGISQREGLASWISAQNRWNLLDGLDDPTLLDACRIFGVGVIPYTPLASGIMTGKYRQGEPPPPGTRAGDTPFARARLSDAKVAAVERLKPWCEARGHTTAELGIAYLLSFPEVPVVIVGARRPGQIDQNLKALAWTLTPEERAEAERIAKG